MAHVAICKHGFSTSKVCDISVGESSNKCLYNTIPLCKRSWSSKSKRDNLIGAIRFYDKEKFDRCRSLKEVPRRLQWPHGKNGYVPQ